MQDSPLADLPKTIGIPSKSLVGVVSDTLSRTYQSRGGHNGLQSGGKGQAVEALRPSDAELCSSFRPSTLIVVSSDLVARAEEQFDA